MKQARRLTVLSLIRRCCVLIALGGMALGGAWASSLSTVDTAWRQRAIHQNLVDAYRSFSDVAGPALQALKTTSGAADLRRRLQAAARYATAASSRLSQELLCDDLRGWIQEAIDAGPQYRAELFDLYTTQHGISSCRELPDVNLRQLAADLGDSARMYFVLVIEAGQEWRKGEPFRARWLIDQAHSYAVTDLQHVLLALWGYGMESFGRDLKKADEREAARQAESARIEPWRGRVSMDDYPRLKFLFACSADFSLAGDDNQRKLRQLDEVREIAYSSSVSDAERRLFQLRYITTLLELERPYEARDIIERLLLDSANQRGTIQKVLQKFLAEAYAKIGSQSGVAAAASQAALAGSAVPQQALTSTPVGAAASSVAPGLRQEAYIKGLQAIRSEAKAAAESNSSPERAHAVLASVLARESEFHQRFGQYEEALKAELAAKKHLEAEIRDRLKGEDRTRLMARARAEDQQKYELLRTTEVQAATVRGLTIAAGVAVVGVLAVGGALWMVHKRGKALARASAELAERNGELEQRNQSRTQLLAAACHDLRQPAHALGMLVELARDAPPTEADFLPWLNQVGRCTTVMSDMLGELMDLGSLEGGAYKPSLVKVELAELLHDAMLNFAPAARRKGLILEAPPVALAVLSDRHLLRRILFNLVSNAVKYTERGIVQVHVKDGDEEVEISVQDTGPGIPPERLQDVLRDYVRLDSNHAADGLGIGLSVVRRACELLSHALVVTSQVGQGTTVRLRLRRAPGGAAAPTAVPVGSLQPTSGQPPQGLVVVLMEDDSEVRDAVSALLRRWGCVVVAGDDASSVLQGLQASHLTPGLVMTDMNLNGADGLAELAMLREALRDPDLPALVVTGDLDATVGARAAEQRAFVAHKPLGPVKLQSLLRELARWPVDQAVVAQTS